MVPEKTNPSRPQTPQISLRIDSYEVARADALAKSLPKFRPDLRAALVTRATVLRLAVARGLDSLDAEALAAETSAPSPKRRQKA